ncbi:hypothetical protein I6F65_21345 [Pseudoalteromonas sp. SWXJZ94C]|uniref:hypothetical protein n=1 Tax=unclassified Pseudoalteromonas TaxID=194690 RepID=UPI00140A48F5|nr:MULTISPECIES: hypothetical protein [unclassified Pseudoalteromonas]MBH0059480.1 hypothetical protein [Pseudoalteromonas sp. SWXJZ94C]
MSNKEIVIFASIVSAGLITPEEYISCCDDLILKEDEPCELIMDLALLKDKDAAVKRLLSEAYDNFEEMYPFPETGFFEVCVEFIKFQSGNVGWSDFLRSAILIAEQGRCQWSADDFNRFLESYLANDESEILTKNQSEHLAGVLKEEIEKIDLYRKMVEQRNLTSLSS